MELKQVHKYLDLYIEGNSSVIEEQALFAYFSQAEVDKSLAHYKPYFDAIAQQRKQRFSGDFDPTKKLKPLVLKRLAAVAAVVIAGFFVLHQTVKTQPSPEEVAFEEFKANMYLVAEHLNKGKQGLAHIETFNQNTHKYLKRE